LQKQIPKKPKVKKRGRKITKAVFWLLLLAFFASVTIVCFRISYNYVITHDLDEIANQPVVIPEHEKIEFVVDKGASTAMIAAKLKEQGLIKDETIFKLLSKINGYDGTYLSGTHYVSKKLTYDEIMRALSSPPVTRKVTIPEGKTFTQIVDILYSRGMIKDKNEFIKTANTADFDFDFLKGIPKGRDYRLEGYLFPDTYEFDINASYEEIIYKMLSNFDKKFNDEYYKALEVLGEDMTLDKVVILASMIEREAKNPDDRYLISSVIYNRLNNKDKTLRKLQIDATVQYVLLKRTGSYKERLLYEDLEIDDPYNTYIYEGLPPGPICCPGEASIKAALYPEETDYLYYVAKGDGTHVFSRTFKEHQAAIKKYGAK